MEESILTANEDEKTLDYFDRFTPHYKPERFQFGIDFLCEHANASSSLLDIGCGDGATLCMVSENTPVRDLWGIDISGNYLRKAEKQLACQTIEGSILDDPLVAQHLEQFDYCTLGAVIHHLIGNSRRESFEFAAQCMRNSFKLVKPGGALIIFEPTYTPAWLMSAAFWIKKGVSRVTSSRVELLRSWANFGQPVVSYYTSRQIRELAEALPGAELHTCEAFDEYRFAGIIKRKGMGLIIKKSV